jgi:multiple sugar transport system ATP-binding protein
MSGIEILDVSKQYEGNIQAVENLSLQVEDGEFLVLLGPSGCGKTTTLRCVSGLEIPDTGEVFLGEKQVYSADGGINVPARDRHIGMVFQNYALYPHMTVAKNIAFGLKTRKYPKSEIGVRVTEAIAAVGLDELEDRYPRELSGGQQQRVALARVLARRPRYLLFDEPLSNLDPKLRVTLRAELKSLHDHVGATSIYVTHDHNEAMILGDRIAVMENGSIVQVCSGERLYNYPETASIAAFMGNPKTNLLAGEVAHSDDGLLFVPEDDPYNMLRLSHELQEYKGQRIHLHVRPEDVSVRTQLLEDETPLTVMAVMPQGADTLVFLQFESKSGQMVVRSMVSSALDLTIGQPVGVDMSRGNVYSGSTRRIIGSFGY